MGDFAGSAVEVGRGHDFGVTCESRFDPECDCTAWKEDMDECLARMHLAMAG